MQLGIISLPVDAARHRPLQSVWFHVGAPASHSTSPRQRDLHLAATIDSRPPVKAHSSLLSEHSAPTLKTLSLANRMLLLRNTTLKPVGLQRVS
jgi:hypothetical protein